MSAIDNIGIFQDLRGHQTPKSLLPQFIELANGCFAEILFSSLSTGTACLFAATPQVAFSLVVFSVCVLAINIFARIATIFLESSKAGNRDAFSSRSETCKMIPPFTNALLYGTTGNILAHEGGHYAAISLAHTHAQPQVTIDGLFAGSTSWMVRSYTSFGKLLGPLNSRLVIAAAGPLVAVCIATLGIVLALHVGEKYPDLSKYIFFSSNFSIIGHLSYAFSALTADPNDPAHDFVMLWRCGIHPIASAVCLIAIPIFAVLLYLYNKKSNL